MPSFSNSKTRSIYQLLGSFWVFSVDFTLPLLIDPGTENGYYQKAGKIKIRSIVYLIVPYQC